MPSGSFCSGMMSEELLPSGSEAGNSANESTLSCCGFDSEFVITVDYSSDKAISSASDSYMISGCEIM